MNYIAIAKKLRKTNVMIHSENVINHIVIAERVQVFSIKVTRRTKIL